MRQPVLMAAAAEASWLGQGEALRQHGLLGLVLVTQAKETAAVDGERLEQRLVVVVVGAMV